MKGVINKIIVFIIVLHCSCIAFAQNKTIDSLQKILMMQKDDTNKVNVLNQLAQQFSLSDDRKNWQHYAGQALVLADKTGFIKGKAYALFLLGALLESDSKYKEARSHYEAALGYYEKLGDKEGMANVYGSVASSYRSEQNRPEALFYTYKALKLYEETGNTVAIATTYLSLALQSVEEKDYEKATKLSNEALTTFTKLGLKNEIAIVQFLLAGVDFGQGNYNSALERDSVALDLFSEANIVYNKGAVYRNMGEIYERLGDEISGNEKANNSISKYRLALNSYVAAVDIYKLTNTPAFVYSTYTQIGNLYIKLNNPDSARSYLEKSLDYHLKLTAEFKKIYAENLEDLYLVLSKLDSANGNMAKAYEHYKEYVTYKDNRLTEERSKRLQQVKMQYEFDKKESVAKAEQAKKDAEAKNIRNLQYLAIAAFILIAIILYWNSRQKQKAKIKIEHAYSELKSTQSQLIHQEKMASLGQLTAGIAHEIQNPLNFVNNFSEVNNELIEEMNNENDINEIKAIANDIKQNNEKISFHGRRADAIVKGMLQHSKQTTSVKEPTDINKIADEYLRLSYHGVRAKDKSFEVKITTDFDGSIGKINIVPQDIGRVLLNLFNNAFYVVNEKKKQSNGMYEPAVSIITKKENERIMIQVKDNGDGIPQSIVDKIFHPFFTTKPTGQGTGLGLSLAYDIIKAHGGEIKVETMEGEGSVFIIVLPV